MPAPAVHIVNDLKKEATSGTFAKWDPPHFAQR